jgi:TonB family protein
VVAFVVDTTGAPTQVQCRSASDTAFADAAIDAAKQWRLSPAKKGGQPVACAMDATVRFKLTGRE